MNQRKKMINPDWAKKEESLMYQLSYKVNSVNKEWDATS